CSTQNLPPTGWTGSRRARVTPGMEPTNARDRGPRQAYSDLILEARAKGRVSRRMATDSGAPSHHDRRAACDRCLPPLLRKKVRARLLGAELPQGADPVLEVIGLGDLAVSDGLNIDS